MCVNWPFVLLPKLCFYSIPERKGKSQQRDRERVCELVECLWQPLHIHRHVEVVAIMRLF